MDHFRTFSVRQFRASAENRAHVIMQWVLDSSGIHRSWLKKSMFRCNAVEGNNTYDFGLPY